MKILRLVAGIYLLACLSFLCSRSAHAQEGSQILNWQGMPIDTVLKAYAEITGRTLLIDPEIPREKKINLSSQTRLTDEEVLYAVNAVLAMNGVSVHEVGTRFLKVVPSAKFKPEATAVRTGAEGEAELPDSDELVNQFIHLQHITPTEAQAVIVGLVHKLGDNVQLFERTNSLLLTDTASNVKRIMKVLALVDRPSASSEEPFIRQIQHATASDIKVKLEEIIADHLARLAQAKTTPGAAIRSAAVVPRAVAALRPSGPSRTAAPIVTADAGKVEKGAIKGNVKIIADDRTNLLIFITEESNMKFFDILITALDIATAPDVMVEVFQLEFADAVEVAQNLNDFIGNVTTADGSSTAGGTAAGQTAAGGDPTGASSRSSSLRDFIARRNATAAAASQTSSAVKSLLGELSADDITILPDERTNAIIVMASKGDMVTIKELITKMDITLEQVLIEVVIMEVTIGDSLNLGFDWLQRSQIVVDPAKGGSPIMAFAGTGGGGEGAPIDATSVLSTDDLASGIAGLTYFFTYFDLDIDAVLTAVSTDSRVEIRSTPVILTTDNTEAQISLKDQIYVYDGVETDQFGNARTRTTITDVGLDLVITPHINEKGFVQMEVKLDNNSVSGEQAIDGQLWPTVTTRAMTADIGVSDTETIILGGLRGIEKRDTERGVPFLRKLPLVGNLFKSKSDEGRTSELIVLITPYVLADKTRAEAETARLKRSGQFEGWERGWSGSKLAAPSSEELAETAASVAIEQKKASSKTKSDVAAEAAMPEKRSRKSLFDVFRSKPADAIDEESLPLELDGAAEEEIETLPGGLSSVAPAGPKPLGIAPQADVATPSVGAPPDSSIAAPTSVASNPSLRGVRIDDTQRARLLKEEARWKSTLEGIDAAETTEAN